MLRIGNRMVVPKERFIQWVEERGLILVEPTKATTKVGVTRNGTLQFTLLSPPNVIARHYLCCSSKINGMMSFFRHSL